MYLNLVRSQSSASPHSATGTRTRRSGEPASSRSCNESEACELYFNHPDLAHNKPGSAIVRSTFRWCLNLAFNKFRHRTIADLAKSPKLVNFISTIQDFAHNRGSAISFGVLLDGVLNLVRSQSSAFNNKFRHRDSNPGRSGEG